MSKSLDNPLSTAYLVGAPDGESYILEAPMEYTAFIFGSLLIVAISWTSIWNPTSHGFYRFFAFEAILGLLVTNAEAWFREPLSPLHLLSWLSLVGSIVLAVQGFWFLVRAGKPSGYFENTTELVTSGPYRAIRHPLYGSLLLLAWGAFLKDISPLSIVLAIIATGMLIATAKVEEKANLRKFGEAYARYTHETKMFLPRLL
jgi:protein-S-isoprenylcysteine O-methyltransferase Ste14